MSGTQQPGISNMQEGAWIGTCIAWRPLLILCVAVLVAPAGKLAGADKRAAKEITHAVESELSHHPAPHLSNSMTPLGDLHEASTRQLLVSLITTLNASYPDYDFSDLRAEDFEREASPQATINAVNVRHEEAGTAAAAAAAVLSSRRTMH